MQNNNSINNYNSLILAVIYNNAETEKLQIYRTIKGDQGYIYGIIKNQEIYI